MRGTRLLTAAVVLGTAGAVLSMPPAVAADEPVVGLVITRESGTTAREAESLVGDVVGDVEGRTPVAPGVTAVETPGLTAAQAQRAIKELEKLDGIAEVGVDTKVTAASNDPYFADQWSLTHPVAGAQAEPAWTTATGAGQVIAVIDTGITAHEDLTPNLLPGADLIDNAVVANDGDARDGDPSDPGDWVEQADITAHPEDFEGCPTSDSSWHGTHVAGLAAAVRDNAKGIAGIAPDAKILPVRALGKCGGTMSDVAAAIIWASGGEVPGLPSNQNPADVINLSLSSSVTCQPFVQAAIDEAIGRGATVVAAAGNRFGTIANASPGGCYDIIAVGALSRSGSRANYSNQGVAGRDLPIFAAGGTALTEADGLVSTVDSGAKVPSGDAYTPYYGTSMATPLVAGAAALLQQARPMSPAAVAEHLRDTTRPFPVGSNCTGSCGAGILDVSRALTIAPRVPGPVGGLTAAGADGAVSLSWDEPGDPGTGAVTGYAVEYRQAGGPWVISPDPWNSTLRQKLLQDLANGVTYEARVAAKNVFGQGPWTVSAPVTPLALPGATQIRSVTYPSKTSARLELRLPAENIAGLQYRVTRLGRESGQWQETTAGTRLRVSGLTRGVRHTVEVRVFNERGAGTAASRQVATPVKPGVVKALRVKRAGAKATVSWQPPTRTGMDVRYRVRVGKGDWRATSAEKMVLRKVPAGPARFEVRARNEAGLGPVAYIVKRK